MNSKIEELNRLTQSEDELMHYGMPRRSGRYPWGSGDDPYQNACDFLGRVKLLRKQNFTFTDEEGNTHTGDAAIYKSLGLTSSEFRNELSLANDEKKIYLQKSIKTMLEDGHSKTEIARRLGLANESTVRSLMKEETVQNALVTRQTVEFLKKQVDEKGMIDVGSGVEYDLNISRTNLDTALHEMRKQGYELHGGRMEQVTNKGKHTTQKVLCPPGTPHSAIYDLDKIHSLSEYITRDGGQTYEKKFNYPESMNSKRLLIRYKEEGGEERDGTIELRRGVEDLSLGTSRYAQVRILVDGSHYMKGMALYSTEDMPDGVDVIFNTNKPKGTPMQKVLKEIKSDPDNPFGSLIKDAQQGGQYWYEDKDGNKKLGLINKTRDQGDWSDWTDSLPSQFLGKQNLNLAKRQLTIAKQDKMAEYNDILALENPTIKKYYLKKFADGCDTAAVQLKAAALPGQKYHAIIPVNALKDNEIYAPRYENGTKLALVRYPHGGTFEIPIVTVNNKHPVAKKLLGNEIMDAVGINSKVASQLSGADFDGDTVMCIPTHNGKVKIKSDDPLPGLKGFDPKAEYGPHTYEGRKIRLMKKTDVEMGTISNLITDMTLAGADPDELAAAVRHSMVVIDAEKHKLDYRKSEIDHNIAALHNKYQGHYDENGKWKSSGAGTILSRAKSPEYVNKRMGEPKINMPGKSWYDPNKPEGSLIYNEDPTVLTFKKVNKRTGEVTVETQKRKQQSTRMAETDDAHTLVSDMRHPMELLYADYANSMKAMANQARKELMTTEPKPYSAAAKAVYKEEVASLEEKLNNALRNQPKERAAQRKANVEKANKMAAYKEEHGEDMKGKDAGKIGTQALTKFRQEVGSVSRRDRNIEVTDREWEAIQAGAITSNKLMKILNNADPDKLREKAMPKSSTKLTSGQATRIRNLAKSGYTIEEIARKMGKSASTISNVLNGKGVK